MTRGAFVVLAAALLAPLGPGPALAAKAAGTPDEAALREIIAMEEMLKDMEALEQMDLHRDFDALMEEDGNETLNDDGAGAPHAGGRRPGPD